MVEWEWDMENWRKDIAVKIKSIKVYQGWKIEIKSEEQASELIYKAWTRTSNQFK